MPPRRWVSREAAAVCSTANERDPIAAMRRLAAGLIDEVGFDGPPFDPRILASFRNVLDVRPAPMVGAARLIPTDAGLLIEVNEDHSPGKRNFSANHEVSHTLMPTYVDRRVDDTETGAFPTGGAVGTWEEEHLCDVGAAALLLDPRWLRPLARQLSPSIATLLELAELFGASLEATARQLAVLAPWPIAFVFWEERHRKAERAAVGRVAAGQVSMPGMDGFEGARPKLRVANCYQAPSFGHYVANNKSVQDNSPMAACCDAEPLTFGIAPLQLTKNAAPVEFYCENYHAPYKRGAVLRRRVVSLLLPTGQQAGPAEVSTVYQIEAF